MPEAIPSGYAGLFLGLGVLLAVAHVLGECARRLKLPSVLGEILAGLILGPTVLGNLAPDTMTVMFPASGPQATILDGITTISIALFLLVAGMEVDLSTLWKQGRSAIAISTSGMIVPFAIGATAAWFVPEIFGFDPEADKRISSLFFGIALSISALPVIAKTLLDLKLFRSEIGMIVIPAAVVQDVVGWLLFAVVLGMFGVAPRHTTTQSILYVLGFALFCLTVLRKAFDKALPWFQAHLSWPGTAIAVGLSLGLLGAAFSEWAGVHAVFGAFFVGIALGDSRHLSAQVRMSMDIFISHFFAPIFFASIALHVNFWTHFDGALVLVILAIATFGKVGGSVIGGRLAGMKLRDCVAIGVSLNARGAMEIILGLLALRYGLIDEPLFVALVVMAIVTSLMTGPIIRLMLSPKDRPPLSSYLKPQTVRLHLVATDAEAAIRELVACAVASRDGEFSAVEATEAVLARERVLHTGLGQGVAAPHGRVHGLKSPCLVLGLAPHGLDFGALDGKSAKVVVLLLMPADSPELLLEIYADIGTTFTHESTVAKLLQAKSYTEVLAVLRFAQTARVLW